MKYKSIWEMEVAISQKERLPMQVDNLIIGGGITGLAAAYFLKELKQKTILIDKSLLGQGVTSKTTAKISFLQGLIYQTLEENFSFEKSKLYYLAQQEAINLFKQIIQNNNISCDFKKTPSIIFTLEDKGIAKIEKEKAILEKFGVKVKNIEDQRVKKGIRVENTYTFHPLKFLNALANLIVKTVPLYEEVTAYQVTKESDNSYLVKTTKGEIKAKKVIIACHYPFFLFPFFAPLKTYIKREYVTAAKISDFKNKSFAAINIDKQLHSIRFYQDYLIYGSSQQHLTSKIDYQKQYQKSKEDFKTFFGIDPQFCWMNQDVMSHDLLPFIGSLDQNNSLLIATGYNAWGMTNGLFAGKLLSLIIANKSSPYRSLFNPLRKNTPLYINSFLGMFEYIKVYPKALFKKNTTTQITIKGVKYGLYIDENGEKHLVSLLCPHMKCFLVFNACEKTWDCPCHGSRFSIDGDLLEGPATRDITLKKSQ